jgi:hypothetical protein
MLNSGCSIWRLNETTGVWDLMMRWAEIKNQARSPEQLLQIHENELPGAYLLSAERPVSTQASKD